LRTDSSPAAGSAVNRGGDPPSRSELFSASPATSSPVSGSSTAMCPAVCPGVVTTRSPNTSSPSPTATSSRGASIDGMSSAPA
jgi:hypothetical protein